MDTSRAALWISLLSASLSMGCAEEAPRRPGPCDLLAVEAPGPLMAERAATQDPLAKAEIFGREARLTGDGGFRTLAEAAASCALERDPEDPSAHLAHATALYHAHRFAAAEAEALALTASRGGADEWILLGDARMEQGQLDGAADAYQQAANLSPDGAVLDRIMYLRWLWGDRVGALEMAERAVSAAVDAEGRAWSLTWLGWLHALDGRPAPELDAAVALDPKLHQARLFRARARLHQGDAAGAREDLDATWPDFVAVQLRRELDPTVDVAASCELDPRGCAVELAETDPARAARLIEAEWAARQDAMTRAARAWIGSRAGQDTGAEARAALATGSIDPEVLYLCGRVLGDAEVLKQALASGPGLRPSQRAVIEGILGRDGAAPPG